MEVLGMVSWYDITSVFLIENGYLLCSILEVDIFKFPNWRTVGAGELLYFANLRIFAQMKQNLHGSTCCGSVWRSPVVTVTMCGVSGECFTLRY